MKWILCLLLIPLVGCTPNKEAFPSSLLATLRCTQEQMVRVQQETLFCKNETSHISSYCYKTAMIRNCSEGCK